MDEEKQSFRRNEMSDKRLAIIFPGMGYHKDKPLLYYSRKLLEQMGYDVIEVEYGEHFTDRRRMRK